MLHQISKGNKAFRDGGKGQKCHVSKGSCKINSKRFPLDLVTLYSQVRL